MNFLITGGAGYIGSHFVNKLLRERKDIKIIVVDNFSQGRKNIIKNRRVIYYEVDICDQSNLEKIFLNHEINIVVHFAALASVPDSVKNPSEYYVNNIIGGLVLLNVMLKNNVKKIVFSSSASVYGEPISEFINEDDPKIPTNPYGRTKLIFEQILYDYHRAYKMNSISFRYFCAAGCDESGVVGEWHNPETHVIPSIIETLFGKRDMFYIFGTDYSTHDGSGIRDYIHVNDLASAHLSAAEKLMRTEELCAIYNLGINKGFSVLELIGAVEKITDRKISYEVRARRPGDPSRLIADASKVMKELNWLPTYTSIETIIETSLNYFKKIQ